MESAPSFKDASALVPGEGALFAKVETNAGVFTVRLHEGRAPRTVANFVGLATGQQPWVDPDTGLEVRRPLYDGTEVLRALPGLLVHFGDPSNSGRGGPGYTFDDEIHDDLRHRQPGVVSMANAGTRRGQGTNGSQFFVLLDPRPDLDGRYTVFGKVEEGLDVLRRLAEQATDLDDRPLHRSVIERITVVRQTT